MLIYWLHDLAVSIPNQGPKQLGSCRNEADLRTHLLQELTEDFQGSSSSIGDVGIFILFSVLDLPLEALVLLKGIIVNDGERLFEGKKMIVPNLV